MLFNGKQNSTVNNFINEVNAKKTWANDDLNLDDHYLFNQTFYRNNKYVYEDLMPVFSLNFAIILPFDLPFDSKTYSHGKYTTPESRSLFTFIFSSIEEERYTYGGFIETQRCKFKKSITRCEIAVLFEEPIIRIEDDLYNILNKMKAVRAAKYEDESPNFLEDVRTVFKIYNSIRDNSLEILNNIILSYELRIHDYSVRLITLEDIDFFSHFRGIVLDTWETYNWMSLNNTKRFPEEKKETVSDDFYGQCVGSLNYFKVYEFTKYQAHIVNAEYEIFNGSLKNGLILIVSAIEVLVKSVITLYWENEESISIEISNKRIRDIPFKKTLLQLQHILGGNWNLKDDKTILYKWFHECYEKRNGIVHSGVFYNEQTLLKAIFTANDFINHITEKMMKSRYRYLKQIGQLPKIEIKKVFALDDR